MMQHCASTTSPHLATSSLDNSDSYCRDLTSHIKNVEHWNDFHQNTGIRDQGKREYSHKQLGNRKLDKMTEERHLEGLTSKANHWKQQEYFESNKPNGSTRILRSEHVANENKKDISPDGSTTRRVYSHSSTVRVNSNMITKTISNNLTGDGLADLVTFESSLPLDHSPQKGKGNLSKQGALNQRRRPSKGSLKVNVSMEEDSADLYNDDYPSDTRNEFFSQVQVNNVNNSRRSFIVNQQSSQINTRNNYTEYSKSPQEHPEWLKELKDRQSKSSHDSSSVTIDSHSTLDEVDKKPQNYGRNPESSSFRKSITRDKNMVLVVNTGTWTKGKKPDRPLRNHDSPPSRKDNQKNWSKSTISKDTIDLSREQGRNISHSSSRRGNSSHVDETLHYASTDNNSNTSVALTSDQQINQAKNLQHPGKYSHDSSNFPEQKPIIQTSKTRGQSSPIASVVLVEGPSTKIVKSFSHQTKVTNQQFGTFNKKEHLQASPTSGLITINGNHSLSFGTKNQHEPPTSSSRHTQQLEKTQVDATKRETKYTRDSQLQQRKSTIEKSSDPNDNRAIIMNEIRKFDPRTLRKQSESTKVGLTTSWLEGRYAYYDKTHLAKTGNATDEAKREEGKTLTKVKNHSTKIHLSPNQKNIDSNYQIKSSRMIPEREHRSSNPVAIRVNTPEEFRPFERTQSLPTINTVKKKTATDDERWESYEYSDDDELEEEEELDGELFYESEGDEIEEESWVIRRNIDWENLECRKDYENGHQSPPWKNEVRLQPTPSNDPCDKDHESFRIQNVQLRSVSPVINKNNYPSFYFPEIDLRKTHPPHKVPPASFTLPEVELRRTPSLPRLEPEHFSLSHVELHRTPSLPRLEPESFRLPNISLRRTPSIPKTNPTSFTVPNVSLRRTPSLPRLQPDSFQLPDLSLRRTPSLPHLEQTSFELPQVCLRRTPSLSRLEPDSFVLPPVQLRRTPSLPRLDPDHVTLPEFNLRRTPSCPKFEPESFRVPNVSLRRTPSFFRNTPSSFAFPEVQLRRTPSCTHFDSESGCFSNVELRQTSVNVRNESESFSLSEVSLNPVSFLPRSPEFDHFTLPAVELHRTNLWIARNAEDDDNYGYSQSEIIFDDDRDSIGWSPRALSPNLYHRSSPRALNPNIYRTYSEPSLQPTWIQLANEKQQKFYDWEKIEERHKEDSYSEAPWQEESIRKSESIRNLMKEVSQEDKDGIITDGIMSLDRHFGKIGSQESVNSWEWIDPQDGTKHSPEWVEIAKQRQKMRDEMQEREEKALIQSLSISTPSWKKEVKLRATPGVPLINQTESPTLENYKSEPKQSIRPKVKSFTAVNFPTAIKPEGLQNIRLKKTSHLTKVKGPQVGRVLDDTETHIVSPPSLEDHTKSDVFSRKVIYDTGRISPISRNASQRRPENEITVDHVLSSIRLIRQASLSTSDLSGLETTTTVSPPFSRIHENSFINSSTPHLNLLSTNKESEKIRESEVTCFHSTPQWILDLKARKQQGNVNSTLLERDTDYDQDLSADIETSDSNLSRKFSPSLPVKCATWSTYTSRRQFRNVLNEMNSVIADEEVENIHDTQNRENIRNRFSDKNAFSLNKDKNKVNTIYQEETFDKSTSRDYTPSQMERLLPPINSNTNEESGVCNKPLTWWIQVQPSDKQQDLNQHQRKIQNPLHKKINSLVTTRQIPSIKKPSPGPVRKQNVSRSPVLSKQRSSSPNPKFNSPTKKQSSITVTAVSPQTTEKKSVSTSRVRSPATSPTRRSPATSPARRSPASIRGQSPPASTKPRPLQINISVPSVSTTTVQTSKQTGPKKTVSPQRDISKPKSPSSKSTAKLSSTSRKTPVHSTPSTKTEITAGNNRISTVTANSSNKRLSTNIRTPSPDLSKNLHQFPKSPSTSPKSSINRIQSSSESNRTPFKSSTQLRQSTSVHITSTHSTVVDTQQLSPKPGSPNLSTTTNFSPSSASNKGRFTQLLSDLSKSNLQNSSSFLDNAELINQYSSSSRSLNIKKPRVRFSSTEIVWPLDIEEHAPVTTCHHPIQAME